MEGVAHAGLVVGLVGFWGGQGQGRVSAGLSCSGLTGRSIPQPAGLRAVPPLPVHTCKQQEPDGTHPLPRCPPFSGGVMAKRNPKAEQEDNEAWSLGHSRGPLLASGAPPRPGCCWVCPGHPAQQLQRPSSRRWRWQREVPLLTLKAGSLKYPGGRYGTCVAFWKSIHVP